MAKVVKRSAESWAFIPRDDRELPLEQQTRFTLRPMTHAERAATRDDMARSQTAPDGMRTTAPRTRQVAYQLALTHIASIENYPVGAPQPWPLDRDARATYLEQLDDDIVMEVGDEIWRRSHLGADDPAKNFSAPGPTSSSGAPSAAPISTTVPSAAPA